MLEIIKDILKSMSHKFFIIYQKLKAEQDDGEFTLNNEKLVSKIRDLQLSDWKNKLLTEKYGFSKYQMEPNELLGKISQIYRQRDQDFDYQLQ